MVYGFGKENRKWASVPPLDVFFLPPGIDKSLGHYGSRFQECPEGPVVVCKVDLVQVIVQKESVPQSPAVCGRRGSHEYQHQYKAVFYRVSPYPLGEDAC